MPTPTLPNQTSPTTPRPNTRLIIVLDSEHIAKPLEYIRTKLAESNVFVALQTAKYNCGQAQLTSGKSARSADAKSKLGERGQEGPGSPQTFVEGVDNYLSFGKFTLDWIKSNQFNASFTASAIGNRGK